MAKYDGTNPGYDEESEEPEVYQLLRGGGGSGHGGSGGGGPLLPDVQPSLLASGQVLLTTPTGTTARRDFSQIVRWLADDRYPSALALIVDVRGGTPTAANPFAGQTSYLAQGAGERAAPSAAVSAGILQIAYGSGSALRTLEADLRSGSYQLPSCTSCTVSAQLYQGGPSSVTVSAALVPSPAAIAGGRLLNSIRLELAAGASAVLAVPFGARWVSVLGGGATAIGSGQPRVTLYEDAATRGGAAIIQDYAAGAFVGDPGAMVELSGTRSSVTITNEGAATARFTVRFGLEI